MSWGPWDVCCIYFGESRIQPRLSLRLGGEKYLRGKIQRRQARACRRRAFTRHFIGTVSRSIFEPGCLFSYVSIELGIAGIHLPPGHGGRTPPIKPQARVLLRVIHPTRYLPSHSATKVGSTSAGPDRDASSPRTRTCIAPPPAESSLQDRRLGLRRRLRSPGALVSPQDGPG